jgi:hypothetical protein
MTNPISQRNLWLRSALAATTVLAAASGLAVACSSSTTTVSGTDSGTDTGTTSDTGTKETGTKDSGTKDGGTKDTGSTTLYERLGKHAGIRSAVDAIVAQELMNADIASYFFFQSGAPGNGHPTAADVSECFTDLVAEATGGPEKYPATVATVIPDGGDAGEVVTVSGGGDAAADAGVYNCRASMTVIHAPLLISSGTFDTFVSIAGAELTTLGVAPADIITLAADLNSFKSEVVSPTYADAGPEAEPFPGTLDGGDGG